MASFFTDKRLFFPPKIDLRISVELGLKSFACRDLFVVSF